MSSKKTGLSQLYYFIKDGELSNQNIIVTTILKTFGLEDKKVCMYYTYLACLFAGLILALVYMILSLWACIVLLYTLYKIIAFGL